MQQGLEPIQNQPSVGGITIPNSPLTGLAQMAKIGVGAYGMSQAEKKTEEISKKRQEDLANALRSMGVPENKLPSTVQMLNMPETAGMGQSQIQMQMLKNALAGSQGNPMNPQGPNPSVMAQGQGSMPPAPIDLLGAGDMGKTVYEGINKFNSPVNVRPGGTVYIPGQGPQFTAPQNGMQTNWQNGQPQQGAVPGATGAIQQTSEAGALGKSLGEFHNVTQGSGAQVPVLGRDLQSGKLPPYYAAGNQPTPKAPTGDPWQSIPKLQTPGGFGQTTFQKELQAKQAENANTLGQKFGTQADMSSQRLAYNQQALELLNTSATGPLALQSAQLKNWLVSSNLVPESAFKHPPSDTIALNKDLLNAAAEKAKQRYGSRMTQSEVMLQIKQGAPNVDMTKAAIKYLLDSDNAMAQYHTQQSNDYGKYIQQGGDPMRFEGWYARNFPMSKAVGQVQLHEPTSPSGSVDDLVRKWTSKQ